MTTQGRRSPEIGRIYLIRRCFLDQARVTMRLGPETSTTREREARSVAGKTPNAFRVPSVKGTSMISLLWLVALILLILWAVGFAVNWGGLIWRSWYWRLSLSPSTS